MPMNEFTPEFAKIIRDDPRWQSLINDYFMKGEFPAIAEQFGRVMAALPPETEPKYEIHSLKTWPKYFSAIWNGEKLFELRSNDRNFQVRDGLKLREFDPNTLIYSGRFITADVSYICSDFTGLVSGYVILGLCPESMTRHHES